MILTPRQKSDATRAIVALEKAFAAQGLRDGRRKGEIEVGLLRNTTLDWVELALTIGEARLQETIAAACLALAPFIADAARCRYVVLRHVDAVTQMQQRLTELRPISFGRIPIVASHSLAILRDALAGQ